MSSRTDLRAASAMVLLGAAWVTSCAPGTAISSATRISCDTDADCPNGWVCDAERTKLCAVGALPEPRCGDGFVDHDLGEVCDCGASAGAELPTGCAGPNSDQVANRCRLDCQPAGCGDGVEDDGEACDDGNNDPDDGCSAICQLERCGNGIVEAGEVCDEYGEDTATCSSDCHSDKTCGNGYLDRDKGEECDCGQGVASGGCSHANGDPDGTCTSACTVARCGDAITQTGEACDLGDDPVDGNGTGHGCNRFCTGLEECGDGLVDAAAGETCDDGGPSVTCNDQCGFIFCGNGVVDGPDEECDDPTASIVCGPTCLLVACGNGYVDHNEECDRGVANSNDPLATYAGACRSGCTFPGCGDGITDLIEVCDGSAGCSDDCTRECGDGVITGLEVCDPGNPPGVAPDLGGLSCENFGWYRGTLLCAVGCDALDFASCEGFCGDGVVDVDVGESCDGDTPGTLSCTDFGAAGPIGCTAACQPSTERCFDGGWKPVSLAPATWLTGVWGSGSDDVWMVGWSQDAWHWYAGTWNTVTVGGGDWGGIWGASAGDIWIVGGGGEIRRYQSSAWNLVHSGGAALNAVHGSGVDDVWAVGEGGRVLHDDGGGWAEVAGSPVSVNELNAVLALAPNDVYVAGRDGIWHYDGAWSTDISTVNEFHQGLAVKAPGEIWVFSNAGDIRFRDAANGWDNLLPRPLPQTMMAGAVLSPNLAWAVGSEGTLFRWDGAAWTAPASPVAQQLNAVWAANRYDLWAAGDGTVLHYIGDGWEVEVANSGYGAALTGASASDIWVFALDGSYQRFDGSIWTPGAIPAPAGEVRAAFALTPDDVWVTGTNGMVVRQQTGTWSALPAPSPTAELAAMHGNRGDNVWVVANEAGSSSVYAWSGSGWGGESIPGGPSVLFDLWVLPDDTVWVSGPNTLVRKPAGGSWEAAQDAAGDPVTGDWFNALWGYGASDVWILGNSSQVYHWNGSYVAPMPRVPLLGAITRNLFGTGPDDIWIGTDTGRLIHYDGASWGSIDSPALAEVRGIYASAPDNVVALSGDTILRLPHDLPRAAAGACAPAALISCASSRVGNTLGASDALTAFGGVCAATPSTGGEACFRLDLPVGLRATATLNAIDDELTLLAFGNVPGGRACDLSACVAASSQVRPDPDVLVIDDTPGIDSVFFIVDGPPSAFELAVTCEKP